MKDYTKEHWTARASDRAGWYRVETPTRFIADVNDADYAQAIALVPEMVEALRLVLILVKQWEGKDEHWDRIAGILAKIDGSEDESDGDDDDDRDRCPSCGVHSSLPCRCQ